MQLNAMSHKNLTAFVLLIFLIFSGLLHALDPNKALTQYVNDNWQTDQGLPENTVYSITQTKDGFLWLGTEEGVARFDGVRFTTFDKSNTPQIENNLINALFEDREGNLWIGTYGGGLTEYKNGKFVHYGIKQGLVDNHVICIYEDSQNVIWIGTTNGLSRLNHGRFELYRTDRGLIDNWIVTIADDFAGGVWIGTAKGLCHWQHEKITPVPIAGSQVVFCLYSEAPDDLWIGTFNTLKHLLHNHLDSYNLNTATPNIPVRTIYRDRDKNLLLGTLGNGLNRFRDGKFESFTTKEGFITDMVHSLYEDREGNLWIGSSNGLGRLRNGKFLSYSPAEGLSFDRVWCVFEDSQNQVWIGTDGGGLNLFRNGKFSNFKTQDGLSSDLISALAEDHNGNLWIGTLGGGVNRFSHGQFVRYTTKEGLSGNWIWSIYADHQGGIWFGTYNHGVTLLKKGTFTIYNTSNGFPSDSVHSISETPDGTLYFATVGGGLARWKDGNITTYSTKQGLASDDLKFVYVDSKGTFWITSSNQGLIRLKDGRSTNITQKDGLLNDSIHGILEDNAGNLWMSTNRGIFNVKKQLLEDFALGKIHHIEITRFGKSDGMKSDECNGGFQPSAWKTHDGRLWFPTNNGVVVIDPEHITENRLIPPVRIQEVVVDNELTFQSPNGLVIEPGKDKFEFHYTALSLMDPNKVQFKYKIEGFDRDWVNAGTRRVAYYTHLPAGKYQFKVEACNNDGLWNEAGAMFSFQLKPHFYQTSWFYMLCTLTIIFSGVALHRFRLAQTQARFNAILAERNRLARELHDTLAQGMTGIISQLDAAQEILPASSDQSLDHVVRARDLAKQNLDEARRVIRAMRPQYLEKSGFVPALGHMVTELTANTGIELDIQIDGEERTLPAIVEDNVLRIAQESITNSVKYSRPKSICIELRFRAHRFELRIVDDGTGFDVQKALALDGHFGLLGIQERVKQLGGDSRISSTIGKGTEIFVSVPTA
jgi:ligand-binding sensor domain-containing protein